MARKVAQSLMSPGNVKARGQRMFLRRREKADHWAADTLGPRPVLRRPAPVRASAVEHFESEAELPAPGSVQRSPWHQAEAGVSSWTPKATDISPTAGSKWRPVHHVEPGRSMPKHGGYIAPQVAFGLAKDLTRMQDKGGRMFAKRRARASAEETEDYASEAVQAARTDVMRRIADSYVPPLSAARHEIPDNTVEQPAPSAIRLIGMIERSRATSGGPGATHPASGKLSLVDSVDLDGCNAERCYSHPVASEAFICETAHFPTRKVEKKICVVPPSTLYDGPP